MISWISSWTETIVVAIIIASILEMILPEGKNKKYIKTIIGLYILFVIISPIISKFTNKDFINSIEYEKYFKDSDTKQVISSEIEENNLNNIKSVFIQNLKNDLTMKLKEKGYMIINYDIEVDINVEENYGNVKYIKLTIDYLEKNKEENTNQNKISNSVVEVETINITINSNQENNLEEEQESLITENDKKEMRKYISNEYEIEQEKVFIQ